ncbi:MAG: lasso peptide isopeptide bond-forming cyclase [Geitlerinemataceae cyanobacterium]
MSGIVGIFYLDDRNVDRTQLNRLVDTLAHRGPDGAKSWSQGSIGFGHRMLWTTPESLLETLPLANATGNVVLTADARIDNRDELIDILGLNDRPAEKITDSQLILSAYEKWGEDCPQYLLGDFAFAIWNERQQTLFCARDHFGIKPLYYCLQRGRVFCFASEIKAILSLPEIPRRVNEVRIADYLYPMLEDKSITAYEGIFRLPPAQTLTVNARGDIQLQTYWSLQVGKTVRFDSEEEYASAFREIFTEAVRCRVRSAFPVGSQLSGGLDSSSVTCVARNLLQAEGEQLHAFSNVYDEVPECDERSFMNEVLAQGGLTPHYIHPDRLGPLSEWENMFPPDEEPCLVGANAYLVWESNRQTAKTGVRVVLDGFDGDTTVSHGTGYFAELARQGNWKTFAAEAQAISQHFDTSATALLYRFGLSYLEELARQWKWLTFFQAARGMGQHFKIRSYTKLFLRHGLKPIIPASVLRIWHKLRGHNPLPEKETSIAPQFARRIGITDRDRLFHKNDRPITTDAEEQLQAFNSGCFALVLEQVDRASAAFSLEFRHPFMDKRLIEFCMAVPASQKLHQGWTRMIMRRAMQDILPEAIQWRGGKTDLSANCFHGLLKFDRELMDEVVRKDLTNVETYIDVPAFHKSYNRILADKSGSDEDVNHLIRGIGLAIWLRRTQTTPSLSRTRDRISESVPT